MNGPNLAEAGNGQTRHCINVQGAEMRAQKWIIVASFSWMAAVGSTGVAQAGGRTRGAPEKSTAARSTAKVDSAKHETSSAVENNAAAESLGSHSIIREKDGFEHPVTAPGEFQPRSII